MREKITFIVIGTAGTSTKQASVSKAFLAFLCLMLTAGLGAIGYGVYHYDKLQNELADKHLLKESIASQKSEIITQRKQIQMFAGEMNSLKSKLMALNKFESQIRIVANLDDAQDQSGLFGVGGSIPEDLDVNIRLGKKHDSLIREMHDELKQIDAAMVTQEDGFESLLKQIDDQKNLLASTPAITPARGTITSKFGYRKSPFTSKSEFHKGLDIGAPKGTPVVATADGTVSFAGNKGFLGKMVVIDHGHGMVTRYAHLNSYCVKDGAAVKRGDSIAKIGNSGRSTGPHLHYEVRLNGTPVNPSKYMLD